MQPKNRNSEADLDSLQRDFYDHMTADRIRDKETTDKLNKLMPLVDLIPTLKNIVEEKQALTYLGKLIVKWVSFIAAIVGIIYSLFRLGHGK